jgi:hypothetical protein
MGGIGQVVGWSQRGKSQASRSEKSLNCFKLQGELTTSHRGGGKGVDGRETLRNNSGNFSIKRCCQLGPAGLRWQGRWELK